MFVLLDAITTSPQTKGIQYPLFVFPIKEYGMKRNGGSFSQTFLTETYSDFSLYNDFILKTGLSLCLRRLCEDL